GHGTIDHVQVFLFLLNEEVGAVQGYPAVVPHNAAPAVGIRQASEQTGVAGQAGALRVGVKHALVVGLAIEAEVALDFRIQLVAVLLQGGGGVANAAEGVDDALEGSVSLE